MAEKIGTMWEEGERLARAGSVHEALLRFTRAKALLIEESKNYDSPSKKQKK
jgi:hypothetical protein